MNRGQRKLHARLWPILALLILGGLASAMVVKSHIQERQGQLPLAPGGS